MLTDVIISVCPVRRLAWALVGIDTNTGELGFRDTPGEDAFGSQVRQQNMHAASMGAWDDGGWTCDGACIHMPVWMW